MGAIEGREKELEKRFAPGEVIVREGDDSREMFIIQEGRVQISKHINGIDVPLATLGKGAFFGEMSLLESLPRTATVVALEPTQLLVFQAGGLLLRLRRDPTLAFEMLQQLSGRIRAMNDRLTQMLTSGKFSGEDLHKLVEAMEDAGPYDAN